jgi:hypothetical protein
MQGTPSMGSSLYILGADPTENTVSIVIPQNTSIVACSFVAAGTYLPSRCLAKNVYSLPLFRLSGVMSIHMKIIIKLK